MRQNIKLLIILMVLLPVFSIFAQSAGAGSPEALFESAYLFSRHENLHVEFTMDIHRDGGVKERGMEIYLNQEEDEWKLLAQITSPGFLRNMKYLLHHGEDGTESRWLKTSRGVKRVSGDGKDEALFGSDFSVADISAVDGDYDSLRDEGLTELGGREVRLLSLTFSDSVYSRKDVYIDTATSLYLGADIYDDSGRLLKTYRLLQWREEGGELIPEECRMISGAGDSWTDLEVQVLERESSIPSRYFSRGNL